jgi:hypothetical protein
MDFVDDVLVIESDLIYEPRVLDRLLSSPYENVALLDHYRAGMDGTVVTLGETGSVTQVIPPALQSSDFSFADKYKTLNIYRFNKDFCRDFLQKLLTYYTQTFDKNAYYELMLGILIYMQQADIHGEVLDGERWAEVDDPNDLAVAEFTFNASARYESLTQGWGGNWNNEVLDFAFIRNMYFPTPAMLSELRLNLPDLLHNYGSRQAIPSATRGCVPGSRARRSSSPTPPSGSMPEPFRTQSATGTVRASTGRRSSSTEPARTSSSSSIRTIRPAPRSRPTTSVRSPLAIRTRRSSSTRASSSSRTRPPSWRDSCATTCRTCWSSRA